MKCCASVFFPPSHSRRILLAPTQYFLHENHCFSNHMEPLCIQQAEFHSFYVVCSKDGAEREISNVIVLRSLQCKPLALFTLKWTHRRGRLVSLRKFTKRIFFCCCGAADGCYWCSGWSSYTCVINFFESIFSYTFDLIYIQTDRAEFFFIDGMCSWKLFG